MSTLDAAAFQDVIDFIGDSIIASLPDTLSFSSAHSHTSRIFQGNEIAPKDFISQFLIHKEGEKEGSCWSPSVFANGHRSNENAQFASLATLDCDRGDHIEEIAGKVQRLGVATLLITSHSHLTKHALVSLTEWKRLQAQSPDLTAERYLLKNGYREQVAHGAEFVRTGCEKKIVRRKGAPYYKITHNPCPKCRVIVFSKPWERSNYPDMRSAAAAYKEGLNRLADELDLKIDQNALDPARLFFDGRHRRGGAFEALFIPGKVADVWSTSYTEGDPDFSQFRHRRFSIDDVRAMVAVIPNDHHFTERRNWIALLAAIYSATNGSDAGRNIAETWSANWTEGPHDSEAFDNVWRSLTTRVDGATAGTLFYHAKRCGWKESTSTTELAPHGDTWNGTKFAERYFDKLLYDASSKTWMLYEDPFWVQLSVPALDELCKITAREILQDRIAEYRSNPDDSSAAKNSILAKRVYSNLPLIKRMAEAASSEQGMFVISPAAFDRKHELFCTQTDVINIMTGERIASSPGLRLSKKGGSSFDPHATAPNWEKFLRRVLPDPALLEFVQRAVGYTATGLVDEEVVFTLFGTGANGKSVFANVIASVFGDYSAALGSALITRGKNEGEVARLIARLPGIRLALVNETGVGDFWDSQRLKELASREKMSARKLYQEAFDFMPTAKIWIRTNHLPGVLDPGDGFWRRILAVPFTEQIPAAERIPDLDRQIIENELPGVLNWIITGAQKWREIGLSPPRVVEDVTREYRHETDLMGLWLEECCVSRLDAQVLVSDAYASYSAFCEKNGVSSGSMMSFSRAMTSRGTRRHPGKAKRRFVGFELRDRFDRDDTFDEVDDLV
ncbi:phage/plasmid primase, P4 family [Rhizobium leguminosarum]